MAQDPNEAKEEDNKGLSFSALIQAAKDKKNEIAAKMEKLDSDTTDISILMEMALKELSNYEKKLNSLADQTEGKINLLSQFKKAKGVVYIHSIKIGVGVIGGAYGRGILINNSDAGWSLPLAVAKPEIKLGPQVEAIEEDQILLLSSDSTVKAFVSGKTSVSIGVDAFVAAGTSGASVTTDKTDVTSGAQSGVGGGATVDFGTLQDFKEANEAFYGKDYGIERILNVSPSMDTSELVKNLGDDKLKTTKKFIELLEGFVVSATDEMAKTQKSNDEPAT